MSTTLTCYSLASYSYLIHEFLRPVLLIYANCDLISFFLNAIGFDKYFSLKKYNFLVISPWFRFKGLQCFILYYFNLLCLFYFIFFILFNKKSVEILCELNIKTESNEFHIIYIQCLDLI